MFNLFFVQNVLHENKGGKYKDSDFDLLASPLWWKQCIRQPSFTMVLLANLILRSRLLGGNDWCLCKVPQLPGFWSGLTWYYLANHGRQISITQKRILRISNSRWIFCCFIIAEGSPFRSHIDNPVT